MSVPSETGDTPDFLRRRIAFYGKVTFLLSLLFWVVQQGLALVLLGPSGAWLVEPGATLHHVALAVHAAVWLGARSMPSVRALRALDAVGTVGGTMPYSLMIVFVAEEGPHELPACLCLLAILTARAVLVPSSGRRTFWIGVLSASFLVAMIPLSLGLAESFLRALYAACWGAVAVTISTVASRVIFGLSQRVRDARRLGQYELIRELGHGGMGVVYEATHAMLRRPTAVKLLLSDRVGPEALARFEREVIATAKLTHPNTIAIYDYGRTRNGQFYYAMELLDGVDLQRMVELDGPQPPARVIHLLAAACGALAEAHGLGLIHRDIKPANLMVCHRGGQADVLKVLDFGLVKQQLDADAMASGNLSRADVIRGTPTYLSPEAIATPEAVDGRSDLYALGALGYFLLTGRPPFEGGTVVEICAAHLHSEPLPPSASAAVPADLEAVILRCLRKAPVDRFRSARALEAALMACADAGAWRQPEARAWWERWGVSGIGSKASRPTPALERTLDVRRAPKTA